MTRDAKNAVRQEAIDRLKTWIKPGDTVYTQLKHVSRSGMMRVIQVVKIECSPERKEPDVLYLGYNVAQAIDMRYDRDREGVRIGGCGMDMGFAIVYDLSRVLFREGFDCIGEGCPANDHVNRDTPPEGTCRDHVERKSGICRDQNCKPWRHSDPGYALRQRWL